MALICYQDGFVLVGSVAGQRYWSSMLNLESTITCGIWTPDDQHVYFGTTDGQIVVMDVHGTMVAQVGVMDDMAIVGMTWSCEKFKMEETEDDSADAGDSKRSTTFRMNGRNVVLAVCFRNGVVYIMKNYDDLTPIIIHTSLKGIKMEWSNSGEILAICGIAGETKCGEYLNVVKFFSEIGSLRYTVSVPNTQHPVSAMTWGHNDKRLFIATGCHIHIAWVNRKMASLQLLSRLVVHSHLSDEAQAVQLRIPRCLSVLLSGLFVQTIKCYIPEPSSMRQFVSRPPAGNARLHCTMIRHDDDLNLTSGTCYTLYLEYLGGLVPLLKGKRTSKIRPEFVIYDPQTSDSSSSTESVGDSSSSSGGGGGGGKSGHGYVNGFHINNNISDLSDSDYEDSCASPRLQRRRKLRRRLLREQYMDNEQRLVDELAYIDTLPEVHEKLVEVTSNIWGTKFKIHGVSSFLPANLGQVTYKTSLLHLQPRQMTLIITELRDDIQPDRDPNFNPNAFSEDEDEQIVAGDGNNNTNNAPGPPHSFKDRIPVAPMTPRREIPVAGNGGDWVTQRNARGSGSRRTGCAKPPETPARFASLAQPEVDSESDEFPYVNFTANNELLHLLDKSKKVKGYSSRMEASTSSSSTPASPIPTRRFWDSEETSQQPRVPQLGAVPKASAKRAGKEMKIATRSPLSAENHVGTPQIAPILVKPPWNFPPRWAENARDLKYIDDDEETTHLRTPTNGPYQARLLSRYRSRSVSYLNSVDVLSMSAAGDMTRTGSLRETKRRLVLSPNRCSRPRTKLQQCGKSRSLDSGMLSKELPFGPMQSAPRVKKKAAQTQQTQPVAIEPTERMCQAVANKLMDYRSHGETRSRRAKDVQKGTSSSPSSLSTSPLSKSLSSTPTHSSKGAKRPKSSSPIRKALLNSPLLSRRSRRAKVIESSDDEVAFSGDELLTHSYKDLENFQKAQIRQKLRKGRTSSENGTCSPVTARRREFVMYNKAPLWNENSQVYQLDFGGRVTQESAKNFQIEFKGKQVMQFGRIDGNAYTLDFQYPFTAIQAFAVALANVTQRLK
uniref:Uncharacterized protein n=1 Tax=Strigamia maritima TaxID=126957 RepID=T1J4N8_STRMM